MKEKIVQYIFQLSIAFILGYFGLLALFDPSLQASLWVSPVISSFLGKIAPIKFFVFIFGILQLSVAMLLAIGKLEKKALAFSAIIFFAVILNLGFNEIAFRDAVILMGIFYLYVSKNDLKK